MKKFLFILFFSFYFSFIFLFINLFIFNEIFCNNSLLYFFYNYFNHFLLNYPNIIFYIKISFLISCFIFYFIIFIKIFSYFFPFFIFNSSKKYINNSAILVVTTVEKNNYYLTLKGLYQNILVIGSIGSGKTSSFLYPITSKLINFSAKDDFPGAFLILDVKGNYHFFVNQLCHVMHCDYRLIVLGINTKFKYNPLHKPFLKASVLANRLKNILLIFSPEQTESFWLDKAEQVMTEAIKLIRLYNFKYVTFIELHKIIMSREYYNEKINYLKSLFLNHKLKEKQIAEFYSSLSFFEDEFYSLDDRSIAIIKSEISRITNIFVSDIDISNSFCPSKEELNFPGFDFCLKNNKIVVLNMNISQYKNLSKIIAAYLKLDFQSEVLSQLSKNRSIYPSCFICDEYHEYVTADDAFFFSQSREAKCINIVSTQSYSSILASLKSCDLTKVLIQSLINKFWFRTDDLFTIEEIQKQIGSEMKLQETINFTESAKSSKYNFILNSFMSEDSNISESYSKSFQKDFVFDTSFFTQKLDTFSCLAFISDGFKILPIKKLFLSPYYLKGRD